MSSLVTATYVALRSPARLAEAMNEKGHTVRSLAETTGLKPAMLGHLRSGRNQRTSSTNASAIATALDADFTSLWTIQDAHLFTGKPVPSGI